MHFFIHFTWRCLSVIKAKICIYFNRKDSKNSSNTPFSNQRSVRSCFFSCSCECLNLCFSEAPYWCSRTNLVSFASSSCSEQESALLFLDSSCVLELFDVFCRRLLRRWTPLSFISWLGSLAVSGHDDQRHVTRRHTFGFLVSTVLCSSPVYQCTYWFFLSVKFMISCFFWLSPDRSCFSKAPSCRFASYLSIFLTGFCDVIENSWRLVWSANTLLHALNFLGLVFIRLQRTNCWLDGPVGWETD